jgi:dTDP-L-rhamnose 4-epimerase
VVEALLAAGLEPFVLDLREPQIDVEHVRGDVRDAEAVERALRDAPLICHQAAMVGLSTNLEDLPDYAAHNDLGTAVLLRALARRRPRRLVLASSMVVYGEGGYRCARHGAVKPPPRARAALEAGHFESSCPKCSEPLSPESIGELAPPDPRNVYAATKLHQEHLGFAFARETDIPVTALRYHNVYGPRMPRDTPYAGVAALFADALAAARAPRVFEDGRQLRDFVHVRDVARANVLALTVDAPLTGALNIASGDPRSVGEMADALYRAAPAGAPAPLITGEFRLGDVRHVFADPTRAARQLGFNAKEDFRAGMGELSLALRDGPPPPGAIEPAATRPLDALGVGDRGAVR